MTTEEKLELAKAALLRIYQSDPGPAFYIARDALQALEEDEDE